MGEVHLISIDKSNNALKQSLIQHVSNLTANSNAVSSQWIINRTVLNPDRTLRSEAQERDSNEVKLISENYGMWAHYWGGHLYPIPHFFCFPKNQPVLQLWLSWHHPDVTH